MPLESLMAKEVKKGRKPAGGKGGGRGAKPAGRGGRGGGRGAGRDGGRSKKDHECVAGPSSLRFCPPPASAAAELPAHTHRAAQAGHPQGRRRRRRRHPQEAQDPAQGRARWPPED